MVQIAPIHSLGQIDQFPVLSELSGSLLIDDKSVIGDFAGLQIRDLDAAQLDDDFKAKAEMCKSHEDFREALCETLIAPETCLEAYVLLNHLYPEHRLSIVRGSFRYNAPENAKIPLRIVSGDTSVVVRVNLASFGNITQSYWRKRLGVRTEIEKTLDETRPGWREEMIELDKKVQEEIKRGESSVPEDSVPEDSVPCTTKK